MVIGLLLLRVDTGIFTYLGIISRVLHVVLRLRPFERCLLNIYSVYSIILYVVSMDI